jgi:hypothetical protein
MNFEELEWNEMAPWKNAPKRAVWSLSNGWHLSIMEELDLDTTLVGYEIAVLGKDGKMVNENNHGLPENVDGYLDVPNHPDTFVFSWGVMNGMTKEEIIDLSAWVEQHGK